MSSDDRLRGALREIAYEIAGDGVNVVEHFIQEIIADGRIGLLPTQDEWKAMYRYYSTTIGQFDHTVKSGFARENEPEQE